MLALLLSPTSELEAAVMVCVQGASSGVYCGPLRLLAMEVYDNCNVEGTYCNLITGGGCKSAWLAADCWLAG